uniref:Cytochrome c oxidase subunit 3 n=1 Tax=Chiridota heheva TaxID=2743191 RepID=A0A8E5NM84_9ECHN|nr:cytochrome c oxidase subunit III [Chiridota heheva]QVD42797.1 cytochrome c oxidase subunit III [Chiridota heheva]
MTHQHPFHIVDPSPWPLAGACSAFVLTTGLVMWFHENNVFLLILGFLIFCLTCYCWWRDVIREGTFMGAHTLAVTSGLRCGMVLFIVSEIMFFFSFFWAFFHSALAPTPQIGCCWPPVGVETIDPFAIPLLNTAILLGSGVTVTWAHRTILEGNRRDSLISLTITVLLGLFFTGLQGWEYIEAPFTIADSVYGSTFFVATGFHGMHVIIGTIFLFVCLVRLYLSHFSTGHHFGFEAASWYWHFVDVVWIFLYLFIYWWGSIV